ncbi:DUF6482 family protein [Isoalcanivorax indicus]|uniref:DUF6482 family protein n=1 Tax=Isoalcanivorax indicus TaxID=2202653 RepID=UPI001B85EF43|nr:DUF6482 family protein [Isoalcanivorax indicus]
MKMRVGQLRNVVVGRLRIRSVDLSLYTVEVQLGGGWHVLVDDQGKVLSFRSMEAVRKALAFLEVLDATLLHASPYNEMIGIEPTRVPPMEVPIDWPGDGQPGARRHARRRRFGRPLR